MKNIIFLSLIALNAALLTAENIYSIKIQDSNANTEAVFNNDFEFHFRKNLLNSGRVKLGGYLYKNIIGEEIQPVSHEIYVEFIKNSLIYEGLITVINLNTSTVEFSFSRKFQNREIEQPAYCAQILADEFLKKIRVIATIIDRKGDEFVLDAGKNLSIKKGDKFNILDFSDSAENQAILGKLVVVAVHSSKCYVKVLGQYTNIGYGATCVLVTDQESLDKDCQDIFIPAIIDRKAGCNLSVSSFPSECSIYIDNCMCESKTPALIKRLKPGTVTLSLYKPGYKRHTEVIEFVAGAELERHINLQKNIAFGFLDIETHPPGTNVFIDDNYIGAAPLDNQKIKTGLHSFKIKMNGYKTANQRFYVRENEHKSFSIMLEKIPAFVEQEDCTNSKIKMHILNSIKLLKLNKAFMALQSLKRAYEIDQNCHVIFYLKGVIEWLELNRRANAAESFNKAQQLGFQFSKKRPHPAKLNTKDIIKLLDSIEKQYTSDIY